MKSAVRAYLRSKAIQYAFVGLQSTRSMMQNATVYKTVKMIANQTHQYHFFEYVPVTRRR